MNASDYRNNAVHEFVEIIGGMREDGRLDAVDNNDLIVIDEMLALIQRWVAREEQENLGYDWTTGPVT